MSYCIRSELKKGRAVVPRVVVLFDSVTNSVFEGQTFQTLLRTAPDYSKTVIITFETQSPPDTIIHQIIEAGFECIIKKKIPFIVQEQLLFHSIWLRKYLQSFSSHFLFARGPHASYIALHAMNESTKKILIQARGLCAEEYRFFNPQRGIIQRLRFLSMHRLEKHVYSFKHPLIQLEAVSNALKDYLIQNFHALPHNISIAHHDIPKPIEYTKRLQWKKEMRKLLSLTDDQRIYCYNGSAKPWQCAKESIEYFKEILRTNPTVHLLILSPDTQLFIQLCKELPTKSYTIKKVRYSEIYQYLAIADYGILFRKPHIINWVSRPTKWLEYNAVGLQIIHNQTVACLQE